MKFNNVLFGPKTLSISNVGVYFHFAVCQDKQLHQELSKPQRADCEAI